MLSQNQKGFTIIEVILFLALSSLFLTVAFIGVRGRSEKVQFTDSMRSLHSFLVAQQNQVMNGVNASRTLPADCDTGVGAAPGESNTCVLLGRIVTLGLQSDPTLPELTRLRVETMFGSKTDATPSDSDIDKIIASKPRADTTVLNYDIEWGTVFIPAKSTIGTTKVNRIGWLRSTDSNRIVPVVFGESLPDISVTGTYNPYTQTGVYMGDSVDAKLCFKGANGQLASISFDKDARLVLTFDDGACKT